MGIKLNCKIKGLDKLDKTINTIIKRLPETIENGVEEVLKNIQGCAIRLERGHNENGILIEMVEGATGQVKGRVYTDKKVMPYAMFEHFGTGKFAEMQHIGTTKHFIESGYTEWFIPVNKVNKVEKALGYPIVTINEQQFYIAHRSKS